MFIVSCTMCISVWGVVIGNSESHIINQTKSDYSLIRTKSKSCNLILSVKCMSVD